METQDRLKPGTAERTFVELLSGLCWDWLFESLERSHISSYDNFYSAKVECYYYLLINSMASQNLLEQAKYC